jgi:hypothetical protein
MIRVDGGYLILNYARYRDKDSTAAERQRRWREKQKSNAVTVTGNAVSSRQITHVDVDVDVEEEGKDKSKRRPRASARTAQHLPDDFFLTDERRKVAEAEKVDPERTFAMFTDHWKSASGAKARKRDWDAAWRNWCRSELSKPNGKSGPRLTRYEEIRAKQIADGPGDGPEGDF